MKSQKYILKKIIKEWISMKTNRNSILTVIIVVFAFLLFGFNTPYLEWDYSHTEYAVLGVICHAFVWMFVRFFPFVLIALVVGIVLTRKKK